MTHPSPSQLRSDQAEVVEAALAFVGGTAHSTDPAPWAHIVLPPRTGKTVIAAHILRRAGLHATFVVPTRVLVHQTRRELARHVPELAVGVHFGEASEPVARGLNITTYASLRRHRTRWPAELGAAALVFVDEGHHALTAACRAALTDAFPARAVRIALTATPDYDENRRLEGTFPHQIARVELRDAVVRGLVAPTRVYVAEVDVDGSGVEMVGGDYQPDQLARLLSSGPFLHAALTYRYQPAHRDVPCLVACVTRQQADDLVGYLRRHRPADRPAPGLILGETEPDERDRLLTAFESGQIDTLVQVGVLIEGWTSPRCKLLIDLAPGRSRVRATQKYFRAMTRNGDVEAHLVVVVPRDLPRPPVLPIDLLLDPGDSYVCGESIGEGRRKPVTSAGLSPIDRVRLVHRLVVSARFAVPALDPTRPDDVRDVLGSSPGFAGGGLPGRMAFEATYLDHRLFSGTGRTLLRWVGVAASPGSYERWLGHLYPERMADRILGEPALVSEIGWVPWNDEEAELAVQQGTLEPAPDAEDDLVLRETARRAVAHLGGTKPRHQRMLRAWCGFDGADETYVEIAERENVSRERVRQIILEGVRTCRTGLYEEETSIPVARGRDRDFIRQLGYGVPEDRHPDLERGIALLGLGQPEAAARVLRRLIDAQPRNLEAHAYRAEALVRLGLPVDEHVEAFARSWTARPDTRTRLAGLLLRADRPAEALRVTVNGARCPAWMAAHALVQLGREEEALAHLERQGSGDQPSRYHRVLLRHRASLDVGVALLEAFASGVSMVLELLGDGHSEYVRVTRRSWVTTPGALQWLRRVEDPRIASCTALWDRVDQVAR